MMTLAARLELLLVGIQSLSWFYLLVLSIIGRDWLRLTWTVVREVEGIIFLVLLATGYVVGVLVDRVADYVLTWTKIETLATRIPALRDAVAKDAEPNRVRASAEIGGIPNWLDYARGNVRILRGTVFNAPWLLATLLACLSRSSVLGLDGRLFVVLSVSVGVILVVAPPVYIVAEGVHKARLSVLADHHTCREARTPGPEANRHGHEE
ncbi:hypothetical protein ACFLSF_04220 [Candidatus Bipolaricaulota bacterium]